MIHRPTTAPSGAVESTFLKLVSRQAEVRSVESVGDDFRIVTLEGKDLENRKWTPGDMVQIAFAGWESRAYTPFSYDPARGTARFIGYVHGHGIGSAWLAAPRPQERLFFVGPRGALDLTTLGRPVFFFGDETSLSTAAALRATHSGTHGVTFLFEVNELEGTRRALELFGLESASLILRREGDLHLEQIERRTLEAFEANRRMQGVFTGKASSIQRLYKALKRSGISAKQVTNVAYWAPGRKGLSGVQK